MLMLSHEGLLAIGAISAGALCAWLFVRALKRAVARGVDEGFSSFSREQAPDLPDNNES